MAHSARTQGSVLSLWRYPVKSMMGEELERAEVTEGELLGDRAYALVDRSDGKVATAKNPRKWPQMFGFHAAFGRAPGLGAEVPPVRITLPDATVVSSTLDRLRQLYPPAPSRSGDFAPTSSWRPRTTRKTLSRTAGSGGRSPSGTRCG